MQEYLTTLTLIPLKSVVVLLSSKSYGVYYIKCLQLQEIISEKEKNINIRYSQ